MGRVTFVGLLRRETLSLFHGVHRFARGVYHQREPPRTSARVVTEAERGRPWLPSVLASDASLSGYGAAQSFWSISDIAAVWRFPEVRR